MICAYCNQPFDAAEAGHACDGCSLAGGGCRSVRCPRCGYETPAEPATFARLRAWFRGRVQPAPACGTATLAELMPGQRGTVLSLDAAQPSDARKLMALGVLPGAEITLERRRPAFVLRTGYTELAMDDTLARAVVVRVTA